MVMMIMMLLVVVLVVVFVFVIMMVRKGEVSYSVIELSSYAEFILQNDDKRV